MHPFRQLTKMPLTLEIRPSRRRLLFQVHQRSPETNRIGTDDRGAHPFLRGLVKDRRTCIYKLQDG